MSTSCGANGIIARDAPFGCPRRRAVHWVRYFARNLLVEAHPTFDARVTAVFQRIANGTLTGVTSVVTLMEVLVQPLRRGASDLQQQYRDLLTQSGNFHTVTITPAIAERAAELRARYNVRTPDALQLGTALDAGCDAFLTNDADLQRVTELRVLVLGDLQL